ncbi:MAG TPA: STAS domain-containing protein [Dongiaceae bacterium]|nr:STAS domain-containing protein [Dongiaceae bacterium]
MERTKVKTRRGREMLTSGPVVVMQVPEILNVKEVESFMQELGPLLESNRPRIVLDCSQVRLMESAGVEMLLRCLEEVLKRDGDLKLAALSPEAEVILELMRVARVFETFQTCEDAVRSFNAIPADAVPQNTPWYANVFNELGVVKQAS